MMRLNVFWLMLVMLSSCSTAQDYGYNTSDKKAKKYMAAAEECMKVTPTKMYPDIDCAISNTKKAIERDNNFAQGYARLAELYEMKGDKESALQANLKVLEIDPMYSRSGILQYHIAKLEMELGQYESCLKHAQDYLNFRGNNEILAEQCKRYITNCRFAIEAKKNPVPYYPKNVGPGVNTEHHEYFPALTGDDSKLLFTRVIPDARISQSLGGKQEDFFVSELKEGVWTDAYSVSPNINSMFNEGAPTLSSSGQVLIFTGCELLDLGYGEDRRGKGSCDLFYSFNVGGQWSKPSNFGSPINTWDWESQPSFSSDGRSLYFVRGKRKPRERRDLQEQDIYVTTFDDKTGWSTPKKLGPNVNTPYREESVHIHPDGQTLYFSSNGHPGMGGLDIYMSRKQPDGTWGPAINLGYPINTHEDENSLLVSSKGDLAFFASDREGGYGGLDLYTFVMPEHLRPVFTNYMAGVVYDKTTKDKLEAQLTLIDVETGDTVVSTTSDRKSGEFLLSLPTNRDYIVHAERPGYMFYSEKFEFTQIDEDKPYLLDVPMTPITNSGDIVVLNGVFFDLDKATLKEKSKIELDKLVMYLKNNADVKIQLRGHTDNQGDGDYNMALSQKRAESVRKYLIDHGVEADRLTAKGFGETQPRVDCGNDCTPQQHALNRRTEYKIL